MSYDAGPRFRSQPLASSGGEPHWWSRAETSADEQTAARFVSSEALDAVRSASSIVAIAAPPGHGADALIEHWAQSQTTLGIPATLFRCDVRDAQELWAGVMANTASDVPPTREEAVHALFGCGLPVIVIKLSSGALTHEVLAAIEDVSHDVPHLRAFVTADDPFELHRHARTTLGAIVLGGADLALGSDECLAMLRERWPAATYDDARLAREEFGGVSGLLIEWLRRADAQHPDGEQEMLASMDRAMQAVVAAMPWDDRMRAHSARIALAAGMTIQIARAITESFDEAYELLLSRGMVTPLLTAEPVICLHPVVQRAVIAATRDAVDAAAPLQDPVALTLQAGDPSAALEVAVKQERWSIAAAIAHQRVAEIALRSTPSTLAALMAIPAPSRVDESRFDALVELCGGPRAAGDLTPELLRPSVDRAVLASVREPSRLLFEGYLALGTITERGEFERAYSLHRSLATLIAVHDETIARLARGAPAIRFARAMSSLAREDTADALSCLRPHKADSLTAPGEALELRIRAAAEAFNGRAHRAKRLLRRARDISSDEVAGWMCQGLSEVAAGFLALDTARTQTLLSLACIEGEHRTRFVRHSLLYLRARIRPWSEHDDALDDDLERELHRDGHAGGAVEWPILEAALIERRWQIGAPLGDGTQASPIASLSSLARQRALLAEGDDAAVLAGVRAADDASCPPLIRTELMVLGAQAHRGLGNDDAAVALEAVAASIAAAAGRTGSRRFVIPPDRLDEGKPVLPLQQQSPGPDPSAATANSGWWALSRAEWEVLAELASGMALDEIAAMRYVSRNTVKTQLGSIYRKLGVRSRGEAIQALYERKGARRLSLPS